MRMHVPLLPDSTVTAVALSFRISDPARRRPFCPVGPPARTIASVVPAHFLRPP